MNPGKLSAQVSHASMAFLSNWIRNHMDEYGYVEGYIRGEIAEWINGSFTKIICGAKNKYQLEKACTISNELWLEKNKDYFLIKDNCLTELKPEEVDDNGIGRTLTCIGFRPLPDDIVEKISKKYQLY